MLIRSAFWTGAPADGQEQAFSGLVNDELIPAMRLFPGVQAVHALWPQSREDDPPAIYCQVIVEFASPEDRDLMLSSFERTKLKPKVLAAKELFAGTLSHIEYSVA